MAAERRFLPPAIAALIVLLAPGAGVAQPMPADSNAPRAVLKSSVDEQERPSAGTGRLAAREDTATHHWHDGRRRRPLVIDRFLEADFSGDRPVLRMRGARSISAAGPAGAPGPRAKAESAAAPQSPVFRDDGGQPRALPGGVIVVLQTPLEDAAARALFASVGARPLQPIDATLWLLDSPPGLPSLELANRLHDTGRFAAVEPNWWTPRPRK
jgi:hypothetical protein